MENATDPQTRSNNRVTPRRFASQGSAGTRTPQREVHALAERLRLEYAGAVPPGQVIAVVCRIYRTTLRAGVARERRLDVCEAVARRHLTDLIAAGLRRRAAVLAT